MNKGMSPALAVFLLVIFSATEAAERSRAIHLSYGVEAGNAGSVNAKSLRLGYQHQWQRHWLTEGNWYLTGYWQVEVAAWEQDNGLSVDRINELGVRPVLRQLRRAEPGKSQPYLEAALGVHLLSGERLGKKDLSTHLQFGSHLGLGLLFGFERRFDLGYRFLHLSNAGIEKPNPGVNFHVLQLGYRF